MSQTESRDYRPLTVLPEDGELVYAPDFSTDADETFVCEYTVGYWPQFLTERLEQGLLFDTHEAARLHAERMLKAGKI